MDRRNFLQNLGLLGIIPLVPQWIDKEQFKKITAKTIAKENNLPEGKLSDYPSAKFKGDKNLVIYFGDKIIGYTDNAEIEIINNRVWSWELNKFIRGSKEWNIKFEKLYTLTNDNPQKFVDLLEVGEPLKMVFTQKNYKNIALSGEGYISELNLEAPIYESVNLSGRIEGDGELTQIAL